MPHLVRYPLPRPARVGGNPEIPSRSTLILEAPPTTLINIPTAVGKLIDFYTPAETLSRINIRTGTNTRGSQSITGNGKKISAVAFTLNKTGAPPGVMTAFIFAHSGSFGTSSVPTGGALATSNTIAPDPILNANGAGNGDLIAFKFPTPFLTVDGVNYCIVVEYDDGDASNFVWLHYDGSTPTHGGNKATFDGSWTAQAGHDLNFEVIESQGLTLEGFPVTPLEDTIVNVPVASLALTGFVPIAGIDISAEVPTGALALTGFAPLALENTIVNVPVVALNLTGFVPVALESETVNVPVGTLALTGFVPLALENTIVNVPVANLPLAGFAVTPGENIVTDIPVAALALTGFAVSPVESTLVNVPVGALNLTGFVPSALENTIVGIPLGPLALTGFSPVVLENTIVNVPVASLPIAGFAITPRESILVNVPVGTLDLTGFAVIPGENVVEIIPLGVVNLTGFAVTHDITIPIPLGTLALAGFAPAALEGETVNVPVVSLPLTGFAPTVLENTIVNVPVAALNLAGFAVIPGENVVEEIPLGTIALTGFAITVLEGENVNIPVGSVALTGFAVLAGENVVIDIPVAALALAGFAPIVSESITVEVPVGAINLTGFAPTALIPVIVNVPVATLTLTGFVPTPLETVNDVVVIVPLGILTLTGFIPLVIGANVPAFGQSCDFDLVFPKNVDKLVIPVLQDIEFNLDRLKNIELPDPVIVTDIGEFLALEPVAPSKEVERIAFLYQDFALVTQNVIDGKIAELIAEVKPYDVEYTEWGRAKEDLLEDSEEAVESSFDGEASRGFVAPSGVFNKDISKQSLKLKKNISRANEAFFSKQNTDTLQNMAEGLQAGNQAEAIVRKTDGERQTINLQAVQNLVEIDFRVFELYLERHNSSIEIKRIKHQAWLEEIRAQLLILQEREIAIKGHTLNLTERAKQIEMFNLSIDYLNAKQALKEIDLENFILQAEIERNKLLKFQAEVDKFSALINLNIAKFNLYKAGIDFEESKVDKFREEAAVADAQLGVQNAKTTASRIRADTKIDIANTKLQSQLEKLRAARSRLDTALADGRSRIVNFSGDLLVYQSELRDWITDNADEILENITQKESQRDLDVTGLRDLSRSDVNIVRFDTEAQNIADLANLNAEVIDKSADITAKTEITSKLIHSLVGG